jgi:hypothetical protein
MAVDPQKSFGDFESDEGYPFLAVSKDDKIKFASQPFDSKKNCWIPDEEDGQFSHQIR